jgi:hypothetical protein
MPSNRGGNVKKPRRKQLRHSYWKSRKAIKLRRVFNSPRRVRRPAGKPRQDKYFVIAPAYFVLMSGRSGSVDTDVNQFFEFLEAIRRFRGQSLRIDMTGVRRLVVDAALLFKAELSRAIQTQKLIVSASPPRSTRAQQVLKQTGIDTLLNLKLEVSPDREDVVHWRIAEGPSNKVDPDTLDAIMEDIERATGMAPHPVYQGIIESMGNCVEHAYKEHPDVTRAMPNDPGWWVFQQVKDDYLTVVVCDLGIGVSRALPLALADEPGLLNKLLHIARRTRGEDNRALLAAMEYGRSSTRERQRGKGMRNAHAVVDDVGEGQFVAVSNRGCYLYERTRSPDKTFRRTVKLKHSINGTILRWTLPLKKRSPESPL